MKRLVYLGVAVLLQFGFVICASAQTGSIQGTVVDARGGAIPGASVRAIDQTKGIVVRATTSGSDGVFQLQPLLAGTYTVEIAANSMKQLRRKDVVLDQNQNLSLGEVALEIGANTETVTVEATAPLVETSSADHTAVIDSRQVTEISMNGRDFQSLVRTLPGVVSNDSSDFRVAFNNTDAFHIDGMRGSDNNVFLDGAINTDVGANDGQFTQLSMDAVGEFKLQTSNFAAEYGRNPGVLLAVNTKSGGQQFHGTVYEFHREDSFDANQVFNKINQDGSSQTTPTPNSKLRFNQFGANIGGPIPLPKLSPWNSKKMFFFFNYEGTRAGRPNGGTTYNMPNPAFLGMGTPNGDADFSSLLRGNNFTTVTAATCPAHPTIDAGTVFQPGTIQYDSSQNIICGTPYPGNVIPKAQFGGNYPGFNKYLSQFYLPNATFDPKNPQQLTEHFQDTYHFNKHQEVVRYDWNINAKTNFFFRWVDDSQREAFNGVFGWGTGEPFLPQFRKKPGASWSWNLVNVISPTITNEFIFGYNHLTQVVDVNTTPAHYDKTLLGFAYQDLFPAANVRNTFPGIIADFSTLVEQPFPSTWSSEARAFNWTDNVTKVAGAHTYKFGIFFDYNQAGQQPAWTAESSFDFTNGGPSFFNSSNNGIANLVLGNYKSVTQGNGKFFGAFRFHQFEVYGQDTWKVNRKLTLDYGLRWAYIGPTYTVKPFFESYFDPAAYNPATAVSIFTGPTVFDPATGQPKVDPNGTIELNGSIIPGSGNKLNGLILEGNGIPPGFVDHRYANIEPRLGFAYDPWGSGKWAIRGGFGIFHERIRQNVNSFDALGNPPLLTTPTFFNGTVDQVSPGLVAGNTATPAGVRTPARNGKIPTTYSWSIGVQHELPWKLGLDVAYVGNQARHLQYIEDLNQFPVGSLTGGLTPPPNKTWSAVVPYRGYTSVNYTNFGANSEYNALQVRLDRRFSRSLTLGADYTYSKNRDLSDGDDLFASVRDRFRPKLDYGPTGWDRPNVFNFNYVYDFPSFRNKGTFLRLALGGWETSGVIRAWSGTPFTLSCGGNSGASTSGAGSSTAPFCDYLGGAKYAPGHKDTQTGTLTQWINPFAFAQPQPGSIGNTTRNEFRGPGYQNWNISLFKNFNVTESLRLQLRLETFNTFNHVEFGGNTNGNANLSNAGVSNTIGGFSGPGIAPAANAVGNAGKLVGARDPRQIQLGAKFYF
jgi:Carboxypeptidase regulatory-like domain/TonB-dependent Receptor Plug Domain